MDFIFRIPGRIEELEDRDNFGQFYIVQSTPNPNELSSYLNEAENEFALHGSDFIIKSFDTFYSLIKHFSVVEISLAEKFWSLLNRSLSIFKVELDSFYENFQINQRIIYQNKLQMIVFLFLTLSDIFEADDSSVAIDLVSISSFNSGRTKKKKIKHKAQVYEKNKYNNLKTIEKILSLNLGRLFEPAHFLNAFINIVTKYIFKLLESGSNLLRNTYTENFNEICSIIGIALDKYNYSTNYCMKIIELLQANESLVGVLSQLVAKNIQNDNDIKIIDVLMQINSIDISILSKDNSAPRAISSFLVELAKLCPKKMYQSMLYLTEFLEKESYVLRNGVLEVICNIIIELYPSPTIIRDVQIKNMLLDYLFEHIHDHNSFTRSKVLQCWSKLAEHEAIPLLKLNQVMERIVGRLDDKSCHVRKYAIQFLTQTTKINPFAILTKNELSKIRDHFQKELNNQYKKLSSIDELTKKLIDNFQVQLNNNNIQDNLNEERENIENELNTQNLEQITFDKLKELIILWLNIEKPFLEFWRKKGKHLDLTQNFPDNIPQDDMETAFTYYRSLVCENEFEQALRVLVALKSLYPNEKFFPNQSQRSEMDEDTEDTNVDENGSVEELFDANDHIFLSSMTDFASHFNANLPYELDLARFVFLAPVINFGKTVAQQNDIKNFNLENIIDLNYKKIENDKSGLEKIISAINRQLKLINEAEYFLEMLSKSVPKICHNLQSKNISDVQEAISFFTFAYKLDLPDAIVGVKYMLKLIFTKEKAIKLRLMDAFIEIYLTETVINDENEVYSENENGMQQEVVQSVNLRKTAFLEIRNFSNMILGLNQGELICAEALVQEIYLTKKFTQSHIQVLWERYALKIKPTNSEESRAALIIIGMLASAHPDLIQNEKSLDNLIKISFEDRCNDFRLVADTCDILIRAYHLPSADTCQLFFKLQPNHPLFERLQIIMIDSLKNIEDKYCYPMIASIIKVVLFYAENPESIVSRMITTMYKTIYNSSKIDKNGSSQLCTQKSTTETEDSQPTAKDRLAFNDRILAHFILLLGDVSTFLLVYLEAHIMKEIKIRQTIEEKENLKKKDSQNKKKNKDKNQNRMSKRLTLSSVEDDDEEEMLRSTSNEDMYSEMVFKTCSDHILFGKGMLSKFTKIVERIASDFDGSKYSLVLRTAASSTLTKFMVLSLRYARENRSKISDLLERSKNWEIRSNAIIAFGDLLVRYPNEFEHLSSKIFACLAEDNFTVRRDALMVLTRLILADMIKPKGQISKIARLITDNNETIKGSAQLFFIELGAKNSVYIYNFLPDIISNLSGSNGMPENEFKEMIEFLFERLEKTRNTESLVTKLCHRFQESSDERMWRDISFCLSRLQYSDRALINLQNNFNVFSHTLCYDKVNDNIMNIINSFRKGGNLRNEIKSLLEELENKIKDVRAKGIENQQVQEDNNCN